MRTVPRLRAALARLGARPRTTLRVAFAVVASQFVVSLVVLEAAVHFVLLLLVGLQPIGELPLQIMVGLTAVCVLALVLYARAYLALQRRIGHALAKGGVPVHAVARHRGEGAWRDWLHCVGLVPALLARLPSARVVVRRDVEFHDGLLLDAFLSPRAPARRRPILLFLHGGSWAGGSKAHFPPLLAYLAARGWLCVTAEYRLIPNHPFPAAVVDAKRCVRWLRLHADRFFADPACVVLAGCSAGGHLAAVAALTPGELQPGFEADDCRVQGVVPMHAPLDLRRDAADADNQLERWLERTMIQRARAAAPRLFELVSPALLAERAPPEHIPPFFVIHGESDTLVPIDQARRFVATLRRRRRPVVFVDAPFGNHSFDLLHTPRALLLCRAVHAWTATLFGKR